MPPRKRARHSGIGQGSDPPSSSTPSTPARSQRTPRRGAAPTPVGRRVYRTRHSRVIRGPKLAELAGGAEDLIPPSDDDEYDEWYDLRAVERAQAAEPDERVEQEPAAEPGPSHASQLDDGVGDVFGCHEPPIAGPSTSTPSYTVPHQSSSPCRFVALFSPLSSSASSRSPSPHTASPPDPSMRAGYPVAEQDISTSSCKGKDRADPDGAMEVNVPCTSPPAACPPPSASSGRGKVRANMSPAPPLAPQPASPLSMPPPPLTSPYADKARADPTTSLLPAFQHQISSSSLTSSPPTASPPRRLPLSPDLRASPSSPLHPSPARRTTLDLSSPKPFAMPNSPQGRDHLPSSPVLDAPSRSPAYGAEVAILPQPPLGNETEPPAEGLGLELGGQDVEIGENVEMEAEVVETGGGGGNGGESLSTGEETDPASPLRAASNSPAVLLVASPRLTTGATPTVALSQFRLLHESALGDTAISSELALHTESSVDSEPTTHIETAVLESTGTDVVAPAGPSSPTPEIPTEAAPSAIVAHALQATVASSSEKADPPTAPAASPSMPDAPGATPSSTPPAATSPVTVADAPVSNCAEPPRASTPVPRRSRTPLIDAPGSPMDVDEESQRSERQLSADPGGLDLGEESQLPSQPMILDEESQLPDPIRQVDDNEPWGMDLDVYDGLVDAEMLPGDGPQPLPDEFQPERTTLVVPPQLLPSPSPRPQHSSEQTAVSNQQASSTVPGVSPALSQCMLPPSSSAPLRSPLQQPASLRPGSQQSPSRRTSQLPHFQRPHSQRSPLPNSQRLPPPSGDALELLAAHGGVFPPPPGPPVAAVQVETTPSGATATGPSVDPALADYQARRTIPVTEEQKRRTAEQQKRRGLRLRTALQKKPYTLEREQYEKILRKGGLQKGRRAVAPSAEVRAANDEAKSQEQEGDSTSSGSDATPPDAIVIGATQEQAAQLKAAKRREPKPLVDADYDDYLEEFGIMPDEEDDECQQRLQVIARKRLKKEKEVRRAERAAERTRKGFEALMKETEREKDAAKAKEKEKEKEREARKKAAEQKKATHQRKGSHGSGRKETSKPPSKPPPTRKSTKPSSGTARPRNGPPTTNRTPGGRRVVTYSRRQRPNMQLSNSDSSPLSSAPPSPSESQRPFPPSDLPPTLSTPALTSPMSHRPTTLSPTGPIDPSDLGAALENYAIDDYGGDDFGGMGDFGVFEGSDVDDRPVPVATPDVPISPRTHPSRSSRRLRVIPSSSSHSSDAESSDSNMRETDRDRRRRIAGRMLPRAMLKRLEQEALQQRRRKEDVRRRIRDDSPVRPGHAVVRRGAGALVDDMRDLFNDEDSDTGSDGGTYMHGGMILEAEEGGSDSDNLGRQLVLTLQSDSGSEAMEDNEYPAALARLERGDFEAIVHGRRSVEREPRPERPRGEFRRERRPVLAIAKRVRKAHVGLPRSKVLSESQLYQTRLDFPAEDKMPHKKPSRTSKNKSKGKSKCKSGRGDRDRVRGGARPAIRLDDNVIFATGDFAFSSDSDIEVVGEVPAKPQPLAQMAARGGRLYARSTSSPTPAPQRRAASEHPERLLDEGVGKARSWANFDRFPIDFEITMLPIGVVCSVDSIPGSGALGTLLELLRGGGDLPDVKPITTHTVALHSEMGATEAAAVLPIIADGILNSLKSLMHATSPSSAKPDLRALRFFRDYLARADAEICETVIPALETISARLDEIVLTTNSRRHRALLLHLLEARYALLEIAAIAGGGIERVTTSATSLISLLLVYGFDRTVRPLRRVLSEAADTGIVSDPTVGLWVAVLHVLTEYDQLHPPGTNSAEDTFSLALADALDKRYKGEVGPLAAERIWFLVFGLCAIAQFGLDGAVAEKYTPSPRWALVKRALGHIKISHSKEVEEAAHLDQLQGRDRYIKTVVARCLRLSSTWEWKFDTRSFTVATRDLGMIFKDRGHRNLPTEPPADFPRFIAGFDFPSVRDETGRGSAFELWLRLACVAASDLIGGASELAAAQKDEKDVQRLIMSIFPLSAVPFTRTNQPTPKQLGALVNRYSTMVVACYFSPSLLPWLLANSRKWLAFNTADFESRQVVIRGLMYLGVAARHHAHPLDSVVSRLADILATLQGELEHLGRPTNPPGFPTRVEIERTMVLVVSCFRQIILHPGYTPRTEPMYPDPTLLHECWTGRIFQLDLVKDVKSGLEIVSTIQAFLDARKAALPRRARAARSSRQESLDDYPSLGFDFDDVDLAALGGDEAPEDPIERQDAAFANTILTVICPRIYRLLSDMLPISDTEEASSQGADRLVLINKLTACWSDCAAIVVVEHGLQDWDAYVGPFGQQSWSRIGNELGRIRVGLGFMLNVAHVDPGAFKALEEEFVSLLFQSIVTDRLTVEHKYAAAMFAIPGVLDHALFEGVRLVGVTEEEMGRSAFMEKRLRILEAIFGNIPQLLTSRFTPAEMKALIYRCVNVLVASVGLYEAGIDARRVLHRQGYRVFAGDVVRALRRIAGQVVNEISVPALRGLAWAGAGGGG